MNEEQIRNIFKSINSPSDFGRFKMSPGALSSILIQKGIKLAKKSSGIVNSRKKQILRNWRRGQTFLQIARRYRILPLSVAYALRTSLGFNKKEFARMVRGDNGRPRGLAVRVEREIKQALHFDYLHSPKALRYMRDQGKKGEAIAEKILRKYKIKFLKEDEQLKKQGNKTPDFLFGKKEKLFGRDVFWMESKATIGRLAEARGDWNSQIKHYVKLFGPGIVVYWFGYTDEALEVFNGAYVYSGRSLKKYAEKEISELESRELRL